MAAPGEHQALDLQALVDDFGWIPSVDVCCSCTDCYCDGVACIAKLNPDDERDNPAIEEVQDLIRMGRAWRLMQTLRVAGAEPEDALVVAVAALADAGFGRWPGLDTGGSGGDPQ